MCSQTLTIQFIYTSTYYIYIISAETEIFNTIFSMYQYVRYPESTKTYNNMKSIPKRYLYKYLMILLLYPQCITIISEYIEIFIHSMYDFVYLHLQKHFNITTVCTEKIRSAFYTVRNC